jgi:mRNA interferase MazF
VDRGRCQRLTLVGTLVSQYLGRRGTSKDTEKAFVEQREQLNETLKAQSEQLERTLGEQRIRMLNERFTTAAEQLGSDKPALRLAGVYAMAGLADDWEPPPSPAPARPRPRFTAEVPGGHMRRGEVWWVEFDERRPVVLLSGEDPSGFRAMQVVAPADTDISGLGIEVAVGVQEGLPFDGVLRFALPWPGFTPCTWLTTLSRDDLIERAGAVSAAKLSEIDDALRTSEQKTEWTPAAAARLSEIKDSLRQRAQAGGERTDT